MLKQPSIIKHITERIAYLRKHVKFITNSPGLVWCLEYGLNTLDDGFCDVKNILNEKSSHVISSLQDSKTDLIFKFNEIIKEKEVEIMRLNRMIHLFKEKDIKVQTLIQIIEVQKNKILKISKLWKDQALKNNITNKLLLSRLEEKMKNVLFENTKNTAEKSTQSGIKGGKFQIKFQFPYIIMFQMFL